MRIAPGIFPNSWTAVSPSFNVEGSSPNAQYSLSVNAFYLVSLCGFQCCLAASVIQMGCWRASAPQKGGETLLYSTYHKYAMGVYCFAFKVSGVSGSN